jgi:hypothetical protein
MEFGGRQAPGNNEDIKVLIKYLETIKRKIYETHNRLIETESIISADALKNKYLGKEEHPPSLVEIFKDHHVKMEALIGKEYAAGTVEHLKHRVSKDKCY